MSAWGVGLVKPQVVRLDWGEVCLLVVAWVLVELAEEGVCWLV